MTASYTRATVLALQLEITHGIEQPDGTDKWLSEVGPDQRIKINAALRAFADLLEQRHHMQIGLDMLCAFVALHPGDVTEDAIRGAFPELVDAPRPEDQP